MPDQTPPRIKPTLIHSAGEACLTTESAPELQQLPKPENQAASRFPVAEIFGPTIQGEGRLIGTPCYFIRFGGCDFKCSWCDSMHAVAPEAVRKLPRLTASEIVDKVTSLPGAARWIIISGGNPVLHNLGLLVGMLHNCGYKVAVETQGTHWADWLMSTDLVTVSPKPPSSGMVMDMVKVSNILLSLISYCQLDLKIPILDRADFEFAREVHRQFKYMPLYLSVVNNVGSDSTDSIITRYREIIEWCVTTEDMGDVVCLPQMHVILWGNEKGR